MNRRATKRGRTTSRRGKGKGSRQALTVRQRIMVGVGVVALVALGVQLSREGGVPVEEVREPAIWEDARVRVEVLNAGGVSGQARAATFALRDSGFDVVDFGNADDWDPANPLLESTVLDRVGRLDAAQAVAARLGIDNVQSDPDPNLFVDVTVVVGRNWAGPDSGALTREAGFDRAWWDPRGWFGR